MEKIYKTHSQIRTSEVDVNNNMKISSLLNFMQDAASDHAESLGFGFESLYKQGFFWVLSWMKIKIDKLPGYGDKTILETWPKRFEKFYALRDFHIYLNEQNIIKATTAWILMNTNSGRPVRPEHYPGQIRLSNDIDALDDLPRRLSECSSKESIYQKTVLYSDIDLNQHMNNAKLIEMAYDGFNLKNSDAKQISSIEVNFLSETKLNNNLRVFMDGQSKGDINLEVYNETTHKPAIRCCLKF